jgi:hypothetical protein
MESYIDDNLSIQIENGIMFIDYFIEHGTYDIVDKGIKKKIEMLKGRSFPVVSDMRAVKTSTRESRQRMSEPDAAIGVTAVAVVLNSKVQRVMFNFFSAINKRPAPAKIFTKKEEAIKWAQKFVEINK